MDIKIDTSEHTLKILETSKGFPGNTHEVYNTMNGIKYLGETNPRLDLTSVATEDKNDWFEFEMFNLDEEVKMKTSMVGFRYKEGISWVSDDKMLNLNLKITFDKPKRLNWLNLEGLPKVNSYTDYPIITQVVIKDDYAGVQILTPGIELSESVSINFKPQVVKEVIISISQNDSVLTDVARIYSLDIDPVKIPYFFNDEYKDFSQVDKPSISIESLGLSYDSNNKSIIYPDTATVRSFMNKEYIKSNLFYSTIELTENTKMFVEPIKAYRYMIGLKNVNFRYKEYDKKSIYMTKVFENKEPIRRITLNAQDYIPPNFVKKEGDEPFIKYLLSFNNGETWEKIYPRSRAYEGPCTIVINSHLNVAARNRNETYIDTLLSPNQVSLKIELSRPDDITDETPMVYEYNLDVDGDE
jgi:hypothetical protein